MEFKDFEEREKKTKELIQVLSQRVKEFENKLGVKSSEEIELDEEEESILQFTSEEEVNAFCAKDKFWLFGSTWKGKLNGNCLQVRSYPPLSQSQFQEFMNSKLATPNSLCRFDQFFAKQLETFKPAKLIIKSKASFVSNSNSNGTTNSIPNSNSTSKVKSSLTTSSSKTQSNIKQEANKPSKLKAEPLQLQSQVATINQTFTCDLIVKTILNEMQFQNLLSKEVPSNAKQSFISCVEQIVAHHVTLLQNASLSKGEKSILPKRSPERKMQI